MPLSLAADACVAGRPDLAPAVLLLAAVLLCGGCGSLPGAATQGAGTPARAATPEPKAAAVPSGPHVVVEGAGEDGRDVAIALPRWPEERDLVELRQGVRPDLRFAVDRQSLAISGYDEIRYTFVARSASGVRTVTFEAMRCAPRERIILATGTPDGRWTPTRTPRWQPIDRGNDPVGMRALLHKDIFCPGRQAVTDMRELQAALKSGLHPRAALD